ncbi:MAG: VCBS repeat-containing protein [Deltaproteobacteria bacterium]|nr:VCBS repeat-containing protein [Deltaproteobacteria bacterium]
MRRISVILLFGLILAAGCGETGSAGLTILFPEQDNPLAKELVKTLEVWVLAAGPSGCDALMDGTAQPGDDGYTTLVRVPISYPIAGNLPDIGQVPLGTVTFYVEGRGEAQQVYLHGCQSAEVKSTGQVMVEVLLAWLCKPVDEICDNDIDDDCDGQTDEDCNYCEADSDCQDDNPCTFNLCISEECHYPNIPAGTSCSDADLCTVDDACDSGQCTGTPRDCSGFNGQCTLGSCDSVTGECQAADRDDGTPCDDGNLCTNADACLAGVCTGPSKDCDDDDACTEDSCNEVDGSCVNTRVPRPGQEGPPGDLTCDNDLDDDCDGYTDQDDVASCLGCVIDDDCDDENPCTNDSCMGMICENLMVTDGTTCDDGFFCSVGDICSDGVCDGSARDCSAAAGPCEEGVCEEDLDTCTTRPKADGTACDDGLYCNVGDQCVSGTCSGGGSRDCADQDSCTDDACDEDANSCNHILVPIPGAEGRSVDDTCSNTIDDDCDALTDLNDPDCIECTLDSECDDGNACTTDTCALGYCGSVPVADGTACDDEQYCSENDQCSAGMCGGTLRDCSLVADQCNDGTCDEVNNLCTPQPKADGTACDDGLYCTVSVVCSGGVCDGSPRDCTDTDPCTVDTCDEAAGQCTNTIVENPGAEGPPGQSNCVNGLDDDCDGLTDYQEDPNCYVCLNDTDCNDNNPCTTDTCSLGVCQNPAVAEGTGCSDGLYCTVADECTSAACAGSARDCSAWADECHSALCDDVGDTCYAQQLGDGTPCSDGLYCTVNDVCNSGACEGGSRDCGAWADECHDGVCNDGAGACESQNKSDGTPCEDGLYCSVADQCSLGVCGGGQRDCDDSDVCTIDDCDENGNTCTYTLDPNPGAEGQSVGSTCTNNIDDDCDLLTDMLDPDCADCFSDPECDDSNTCTSDTCTGGICDNSPVANGTPCNDGEYCSTGDQCSGGVCSGNTRDCSSVADECHDGWCDEASDQCVPQNKADGTPCNDGLYCTVGDQCSGGVCDGGLRDCTDVEFCTLDSCNEIENDCDHIWTLHPENQDVCGDGLDQDCDGIDDGCCLGDGTFSSGSTKAVGSNPWFMCSADFNEDGIGDVATNNRGNDTISVLLGQADGSFDDATSYNVGDDPYCVKATDMDADDILDLIVAVQDGDQVAVLWGQGANGRGDGSFGSRLDLALAAGSGPTHLVAGDFNADMIPDIATANWSGENVAVILGQGSDGVGNRTFSAPAYYAVGATGVNPRSITSGDFDADGIEDLAIGNWYGNMISVLYGGGSGGKGDGTFNNVQRFSAGSSQANIQAADFNADGRLDLAVVSMNSNTVNILPGQGSDGRGNGSFGTLTGYPTGSTPVSVDLADLDGDGILDLVVAEYGSNSVGVLLGNGSAGRGDGTFGARNPFSVGTNPAAATVLETNADGIPDIAACNYGSNSVSLLLGQGSAGLGDGSFVIAATISTGSTPSALLAADLDADAILDLAAVHQGQNQVGFYQGSGANGRGDADFSAGWTGSTSNIPRWVAVGDVDGDRIPDLLTANTGNERVSVFIGNGSDAQGSGSYASQVTHNFGRPYMVQLLDLNADRLLDMLVVDNNGDEIEMRLGLGSNGDPDGNFGSVSRTAVGDEPTRFAFGDVDADAIWDMAVTNSQDNTVSILLGQGSSGQGTGGFSAGTQVEVGTEPTHPLLVDLNNDGIEDLVTANRGSNNISVCLGQGSNGRGNGTFGSADNIAVGAGPEMVAAGDFNSDTIVDLATANGGAGSVSILLGNGDGTFQAPSSVIVGGTPAAVVVGHFDWDGRLDLAVSDTANNQITILRGVGVCTTP